MPTDPTQAGEETLLEAQLRWAGKMLSRDNEWEIDADLPILAADEIRRLRSDVSRLCVEVGRALAAQAIAERRLRGES